MQPWKVSVGLTLAVVGPILILLPPRLWYLRPYGALLAEHALAIAIHVGVAIGCFAAVTYWLARKAGLGDLGQKMAHVDRGLREGDSYDTALTDALRRDRAGAWE